GQPVTTAVADLLRVDPEVEAVRLGPARGQDVNVDRGAPADSGQQQFGRGEFRTTAGAERELAAAGVGRRERSLGDALNGHGTVHRPLTHAPTRPGDRGGRQAGPAPLPAAHRDRPGRNSTGISMTPVKASTHQNVALKAAASPAAVWAGR